jgi:hypothetical protein
MRVAAVLAALASTLAPPAAPVPSETERLAAWARLYGVIRWFHPTDAAQEIDWNRLAVEGVVATRAAKSQPDLERTLRELATPIGAGVVIAVDLPATEAPAAAPTPLVAWRHLGFGLGTQSGFKAYQSARTQRPREGTMAWFATLIRRALGSDTSAAVPFDAPLRAGLHADVELGAGLRARVPLVLTDADATTTAEQERQLASRRPLPVTRDAADRDVGLADVVVAWNLFRHFYPYWPETGVDWDARLLALLEEARAAAPSREAYRAVLRRLVAEARDGHGSVTDPGPRGPRGVLPIAVRQVEGRWVVIGSSVTDQVQTGDVILAVDGRASWLAEEEALHSGSPQWRREGAAGALAWGVEGDRVRLELERAGARVAAELTRRSGAGVLERRPEKVGEIQPGVWYVDLTRADWAAVAPHLAPLAGARAVVFDVRGYPTDAGARILPHLMSTPEQATWMHIPRFVEPFARVAGWDDHGWNIAPAAPRIGGKIAFLTDGRAISYAESVMGYVEDLHLGAIVGSPTAGTNGNVNTLALPSGRVVMFTGMRVTRHDGSPFHLAGVRPTLPVEPTLAGIRADRDEVLERALDHLGR